MADPGGHLSANTDNRRPAASRRAPASNGPRACQTKTAASFIAPSHRSTPSAEFEFIMEQLARIPTRRELAKYAFVILFTGAVLGIVGTGLSGATYRSAALIRLARSRWRCGRRCDAERSSPPPKPVTTTASCPEASSTPRARPGSFRWASLSRARFRKRSSSRRCTGFSRPQPMRSA